ncbi:MAG: NosD domain-containing protein [Myxococcota bacterium]
MIDSSTRRSSNPILLAALVFAALQADEARAQCVPLTVTVDSAADLADAVPGNGVCQTSTSVCTLRAAIEELNARACAPGTIRFDMPGSGPRLIQLGESALPVIRSRMIIDGWTQPGSVPNSAPLLTPGNAQPMVELRGNGSTPYGLATLCSDGETSAHVIRGLIFNDFANYAFLNQRCDGVRFVGNYVGVGADGSSDGVGSLGYGILVLDAAANEIGSPSPVDRNVVAGAQLYAIALGGSADPSSPTFRTWQNAIVNNFVGTDGTGRRGISGTDPITGNGIVVVGRSADPFVPDPDPSTAHHELGNRIVANVIGGTLGDGIALLGTPSDPDTQQASAHTLVTGNLIGVGTSALAFLSRGGDDPLPFLASSLRNEGAGIRVGDASMESASRNNRIESNAIAQSAVGIDLALGQFDQVARNLVWANEGAGVRVASQRETLEQNRIWDNQGLGILAEVGGADPLPWLVLESAPSTAGVVLLGTLDLPLPVAPPFSCLRTRVELFANDACDSSGAGEGRDFLEAIELEGCPASFQHVLAHVPARPQLTATADWVVALDFVGGTLEVPLSGSPFSNCVTAPISPAVPALSRAGILALVSGLAVVVTFVARGSARSTRAARRRRSTSVS